MITGYFHIQSNYFNNSLIGKLSEIVVRIPGFSAIKRSHAANKSFNVTFFCF